MNMQISYWYIFLFLTWQKGKGEGNLLLLYNLFSAKDNLLSTGVLII